MNTLAARAASAWYLTLISCRVGMVRLHKHKNRIDTAGLLSFTCDSPYLPRAPGEGDAISRLWQGCHSSRVPLPVGWRTPQGFPSSLWESVSKYHYLPRCHRARSAGSGLGPAEVARTAFSSPPKLSSWRRAPYRYHAGFVLITPYIQFSSVSEESWKSVLHLSPLLGPLCRVF